MQPERLDPLTLPLQGSRLVEASAGTGKTWTIAALYLRLVLGHGRAQPLLPAEILVMTFTKAATRELSERIRSRLVEAAACFRGEAQPAAHDGFLTALLAAHDGAARSTAAWRLAMAAQAMDDAAIHTIDAWCQRMLREHAFDSGCLFDEELQADEAALLDQAVRDHWRQQVYPLDDAALAVALQRWPDPAALRADVAPLLQQPLPAGAGDGSLGDCIAHATGRRAAALAPLKAQAATLAMAMRDWLDPLWQRKDKPIDGRKLGAANGRRWLDTLAAWAADPQAEDLRLGDGAERLGHAWVSAALKPGHDLVLPHCFAAFDAWLQALARLPDTGAALRAHAAARVAQRVQQLKAQAGSYGFADMLQRLDQALDAGLQGERAQRLRQRILQQTPAALIDEFQDTSPLQLSIFDRLFRIADDDPARVLLLIGDPKQSIYAFRGADIGSYLQARRATAGRHHVLGTNHRSTVALVEAVNGCFAQAEARPGAGAFLFRGADGRNELPFVPVVAQGRAERCVAGDGPLPALSFSVDADTLRSKDDSRSRHAALCAERIVQLLADPQAGFVRDGAALQRLRPADIAVLVRTGNEAAAVRRALRQRGVASVYLSDKDSVLASAEAQDLLLLLQAVAAPRDTRLARAALATPLLGLALAELLQLAHDDWAFDTRCEQLAQLHAAWQAQGVLAMLRRALHLFDLPARWLAGDAVASDGERRLTNVLHLAELLQAQSAQLHGEQALIRWLAQQIADTAGGRAGDEQVLRLESDADLVQVVTVHKSKGLEYPLVFLPFAAHFRAVERGNTDFVVQRDADGRRQLLLTPDDAALQQQDHERLREDLRLLYVAMTRARHALWVGVAALKLGRSQRCGWHRSAIGQLVSGDAECTPQGLVADLQALVERLPGVPLLMAPEVLPPATRWRPTTTLPPLLPAPAYSASFDRQWGITSYSALVRGIGGITDEAVAAVRRLRDDEPSTEDTAAPRAAAEQPWHRFPRGALPGNFLHEQLEWLAGEGFALDDAPALQAALRRRCERQGWSHRADDVLAWLRVVCSTPLPPLQAPLAGLDRVLPEMEFWLPGDGLRAQDVDMLCRQHLLPGQPRPALPERTLRGMLMGFADLVFEHQGRWGVLDHKSNTLGPRDADYTHAAMAAAMLEHRYDVQAALYLLALHRLLRARLGAAYDPARQLHGALYLFLRGVQGPMAGAFHLVAPPALLQSLDTLLPAARPEALP